jgi:hypothetical protein
MICDVSNVREETEEKPFIKMIHSYIYRGRDYFGNVFLVNTEVCI